MNHLIKEGGYIIMVSSEWPGCRAWPTVRRDAGDRLMAETPRGSRHVNQNDIVKAAWGEQFA